MQANESPNIMQIAMVPKNGSVNKGIMPKTVVNATINTGRTLVMQPVRIA